MFSDRIFHSYGNCPIVTGENALKMRSVGLLGKQADNGNDYKAGEHAECACIDRGLQQRGE